MMRPCEHETLPDEWAIRHAELIHAYRDALHRGNTTVMKELRELISEIAYDLDLETHQVHLRHRPTGNIEVVIDPDGETRQIGDVEGIDGLAAFAAGMRSGRIFRDERCVKQ